MDNKAIALSLQTIALALRTIADSLVMVANQLNARSVLPEDKYVDPMPWKDVHGKTRFDSNERPF